MTLNRSKVESGHCCPPAGIGQLFLHSQPPPPTPPTTALHTLLHRRLILQRSVFGGGGRLCRGGLHQRDLLLHRRGAEVSGSAGPGRRVLGGCGGRGRAAAKTTCDFLEGLALCLRDFEKGEDEEEDEEGGEDDEDPGPAQLLRRQEG